MISDQYIFRYHAPFVGSVLGASVSDLNELCILFSCLTKTQFPMSIFTGIQRSQLLAVFFVNQTSADYMRKLLK